MLAVVDLCDLHEAGAAISFVSASPSTTRFSLLDQRRHRLRGMDVLAVIFFFERCVPCPSWRCP